MNNLSQLTVIILTHKTNKKTLYDCISSIDSKANILIVENSKLFNFEKEIIEKFKNVEIHCSGENLGYGAGNNYGLLKTKTKYALILNPDVICDANFFNNITKYFNNDLDFSIIGISYYDGNEYDPAGFFNNKNLNEAKFIKNYNLREVDWVVGCGMLINLDKYKNKKIFDENFFLFWEETDLCFRTINKNEKIFMSEDLKINHLGFKSSVVENELSLLKLRNWHYMWSFFYFHKKNFSYFKAFKKTFGRLIRSIIRVIFYSITLNKKNRVIYTYRFLGLINSMIGNKSYYRIED